MGEVRRYFWIEGWMIGKREKVYECVRYCDIKGRIMIDRMSVRTENVEEMRVLCPTALSWLFLFFCALAELKAATLRSWAAWRSL
jgi:hypothetical protein